MGDGVVLELDLSVRGVKAENIGGESPVVLSADRLRYLRVEGFSGGDEVKEPFGEWFRRLVEVGLGFSVYFVAINCFSEAISSLHTGDFVFREAYKGSANAVLWSLCIGNVEVGGAVISVWHEAEGGCRQMSASIVVRVVGAVRWGCDTPCLGCRAIGLQYFFVSFERQIP